MLLRYVLLRYLFLTKFTVSLNEYVLERCMDWEKYVGRENVREILDEGGGGKE